MDLIQTIDINCDLGEGMANDAQLMEYISSCNIACGGHFGTKDTMRTAIQLAKKHGVKVGAHPSYPDKENFGRRSIIIEPEALAKSIKEQLLNFMNVCADEGSTMNHIKFHGALYNDLWKNKETSKIVIQVLTELGISAPIYSPFDSALSELVKGKFEIIQEAFIDRRYQKNGRLLSRNEPNALIEEPALAWEQLHRLYFTQEVSTADGAIIPLTSSTYCIHGDSKSALELIQFIHTQLKSHRIRLHKDE